MDEEDRRKAREGLAQRAGRTFGQAAKFAVEPKFVDRNPPVDIYSEGSPTRRAQGRMSQGPGGVPAVPKIASDIGRGVYEGFTGRPLAPVETRQQMTSANLDRTADNIPRRFTPRPVVQEQKIGPPTRGPLTGNAEVDVRATREFRAADDAFKKSQGQPTWSEFNASIPFPGRPETPSRSFVRESINGNVNRRDTGNGIETIIPFPSAPTSTNYTGRFRPGEEREATNRYNAEVNAFRTLNGQVPFDKAQAILATANAADVPRTSERLDKAQTSADRKNKLADEYLDPNTSDDRRNRIGAMLGIQGDSFDTIDRYENGEKIGQSIYSKKTGQLVGGPDSTPLMQIINSDPKYKKAFDDAPPERKSEIIRKLTETLLSGK